MIEEDMTEESKLNFLVKEDLWLAAEEEPFKILGWTTTKPKFDNGNINKNIALIFSHMSNDNLNFVMAPTGSHYEKWTAEFSQEEIESLTNEGVLELIKMNEIVETDIVSESPELTQGQPILIRESRLFEFNKEAILPKDLYIVMGLRENRQSQGEIITGEKISLRHILDIYSTAIGQKLILK
jgi:hypothetical protein